MQKNRRPEIAGELDDEAMAIEDVSVTADVLNLRLADAEAVRRAVEELPVEFREIVVLREMEGLNYKEIADLSDVPIGTVMSRLARARKQLQKRLRENSDRRQAMNCQQAKSLIEPYADGELDAAGSVEFEQHIHTCPSCEVALRNVLRLKKALKQDSMFFAAPPDMSRRLRAKLNSDSDVRPRRKVWNWNWLTAVTTGMAAACLALLLSVTASRPSAQQRLTDEIVSNHVHSLMVEHALDVKSTDQHTVKPWFNGKLDFSPPVKDLAARGFNLSGGRLDYQAILRILQLPNTVHWPHNNVERLAVAHAEIRINRFGRESGAAVWDYSIPGPICAIYFQTPAAKPELPFLRSDGIAR